MMLGARKILGLAIEERSVLAAEIRIVGGRCELKHAAEFVFPKDLSVDDPTPLGRLLRQFLRENHFAAKRAVLGIPAKWLLVKEKTIPPAGAEAIAGILRMQAERDFSSDLTDLVIDYTDGTDSDQGRSVLLVTTLREKMDRVLAMAHAAGLRVQSVTSSAMALASAATDQSRPGPVYTLHLRPHYAELTIQAGRRFRLVRHLPATNSECTEPSLEGIADQMRQVVSLLPRSQASAEPEGLVIWDGAGLAPAALHSLGERFRLQVKVSEGLSALGIAGTCFAHEADGKCFAVAAALGLAGVRPGQPAIDFLHSRLVAKKKTALGRRVLWATVAAALVVAGVFVLLDWQEEEEDLAALKNRLEEMKEDIQAAKSMIKKVSFARDSYDRTPRFLDCLRGLTLAFPAEGGIWATSLALREDMRGIVSGKAADERVVLEVLDALKRGDAFSDVKLLHMREAGMSSREVSFAVSFAFLGTE